MTSIPLRWRQRLQNFKLAFDQLSLFMAQKSLNPLEQQGLIQCFEYNYELAWNTIKDFYEAQGEFGIQGSRDAFRLAIKRGLVQNGQIWLDMIGSRAQTLDSYNPKVANIVVNDIQTIYFQAFSDLIAALENHPL
jgi:nucleotidyltransferase substrate binding protein (TIGR01987 family)